MSIVELGNNWGIPKPSSWIGEKAYSLHSTHASSDRLEELLLALAIKRKHNKDQVKYAAKRLVATLDLKYFQLFKKAYPSGKIKLNELISNVEQLPFKEKKWSVLAAIFAQEKRMDELFKLIEYSKSSDLLSRHIENLYNFDKALSTQLCWQIISEYLEDHFGRPPSIKMRNFLAQLHQKGLHKLSKDILWKIRRNFSDRPSLIDELVIFRS